ncbi:hypothetical protein BaRGS_00019606 [Batillaria attramentaria]|uniref:Secreted protein n=1 Tax=Batillaria attramentaria TaxID=370345 RepID=A0ABD0KPH9_9CAEN
MPVFALAGRTAASCACCGNLIPQGMTNASVCISHVMPGCVPLESSNILRPSSALSCLVRGQMAGRWFLSEEPSFFVFSARLGA